MNSRENSIIIGENTKNTKSGKRKKNGKQRFNSQSPETWKNKSMEEQDSIGE
jgi:hypothetical protein